MISETAKRDYVLSHSYVINNRYVRLSEKVQRVFHPRIAAGHFGGLNATGDS